jgi:hypothetical protein
MMEKGLKNHDLGWAAITSILKSLSRAWVPKFHRGMFHWSLRIVFELTDNPISILEN